MYLCGVMKKILFFLNIALAVFCVYYFCAPIMKQELSCKTAQQSFNTSHKEISIFEILAEDFTDDSDDSEKEKPAFTQNSLPTLLFTAQNFLNNNFQKTAISNSSFLFSIAIIILFCIFRI